jgi:hypothetical protein
MAEGLSLENELAAELVPDLLEIDDRNRRK